MGRDFSLAYANARDKILNSAIRKTPDLEDGKRPNIRVAHDVLSGGAFSDSEICAEYFGGIMASSRSEDGQDDDVINFVKVVKSMSSKQLHLHYALYNRTNELFVCNGIQADPASGNKLEEHRVWFSSVQLYQEFGWELGTHLHILYREGLISGYAIDIEERDDDTTLFSCYVRPSTFGVMLYAVSHNRYEDWRKFDSSDFGDYEGISLPFLPQ